MSQSHIITEKHDGNKKMKAYVNIYMQQVHSIDESTGTYTAFLELGFRYDVCDFIETQRPYLADHKYMEAAAVIFPEDMKMPWNIMNSTEREVVSEAHFFRDVAKGTSDPKSIVPCELYGDVKSVAGPFTLQRPPPRGTIFKCESYSMNITLGYNSVARLEPFDDLFMFVKIATSDGRPGAEDIEFIYDQRQTSVKGMLQPCGPFYTNETKPMVNQVVEQTKDTEGPVYPRLYFSIRMKRRKIEAIIKYYIIPSLLFILLVVVKPEDNGDFLGLASTLVLADIALLFVTNNDVMTFQEQSVILNTVLLVVATIALTSFVDLETIQYAEVRIALVLCAVVFNVVLLAAHVIYAKVHSQRVRQAISMNDFAAVDTL